MTEPYTVKRFFAAKKALSCRTQLRCIIHWLMHKKIGCVRTTAVFELSFGDNILQDSSTSPASEVHHYLNPLQCNDCSLSLVTVVYSISITLHSTRLALFFHLKVWYWDKLCAAVFSAAIGRKKFCMLPKVLQTVCAQYIISLQNVSVPRFLGTRLYVLMSLTHLSSI